MCSFSEAEDEWRLCGVARMGDMDESGWRKEGAKDALAERAGVESAALGVANASFVEMVCRREPPCGCCMAKLPVAIPAPDAGVASMSKDGGGMPPVLGAAPVAAPGAARLPLECLLGLLCDASRLCMLDVNVDVLVLAACRSISHSSSAALQPDQPDQRQTQQGSE